MDYNKLERYLLEYSRWIRLSKGYDPVLRITFFYIPTHIMNVYVLVVCMYIDFPFFVLG